LPPLPLSLDWEEFVPTAPPVKNEEELLPAESIPVVAAVPPAPIVQETACPCINDKNFQ
jgi:hypothetical protein